MNVICFTEIIKRNKNLPCILRMTHSKQTKSDFIVFSGQRILILTFTFCVLQQSFMHKPQLRKYICSWSPAGTAQQSQDKQVPVLRLFRVSEPFGTKLHTPLPSDEFIESTKYTLSPAYQIKYCTMA